MKLSVYTAGMAKIHRVLIETLTDEEVLALTIDHPEQAGQRAFAFSVKDFESREEMAACMALLLTRLQSIRR